MDNPTLSCDFETRATVDLRKTGVYPYAKDPNTDIWCLAYAFNEEEDVGLWYPGLPIPERIVAHVLQGGEIRAWNAAFERIIWQHILAPRYGFPEPRLEQYYCTAAEAAAMSLPRSLDHCASVVGVREQKDQQGYQLMMRMTRPRSTKGGEIVWWDVPERKERLYAYCKQDVRVERAIGKILRRLTPTEREVYLEDQRINDRGVMIDVPLVKALKGIAQEGIERAELALTDATDGRVSKVTQVGQLKTWLAEEHGIVADSLDKAAVRELLESDLAPDARVAIEARAEAAKSSIKKLDSMLEVVDVDDSRARGLLLYHAAGTGRWGGRLIQPQNMARGTVPEPERFIPAVMADRYDYLDLFYPPLEIAMSLLRGCLVAGPGNILRVADYSAVEARVLNWCAGQEDVLENFRLYDAGDKSRDVYKRMAVAMGRGKTVADVTKEDRQAGKAAELGCGYQMGPGKFVTAAWDVYGVRVTEEQAKTAVDAYRASHPAVVEWWWALNAAAMSAVENPGSIHHAGPVRFTKRGGFLWLILPSGRPLAYARAQIKDKEMPWGEVKPGVAYEGINSFTRKWETEFTYGGKLAENVVQAVSRDLLAEAMLRTRDAGYPNILTVHDELVAETPAGFGSLKEFERLVATVPSWAAGLPLLAEGWEGTRYRK